MAYRYNRSAAALSFSSLPAGKHVDKIWNTLHDLEYALKTAGHEYDVAASYRGKPGEKEAKKVLAAIDATLKAIQDLADSGGTFDKLVDAELKFVKKYGTPEDYADRIRTEIYPR